MLRAAFRRLLALDDPPERTALAFSVGVLIGFSPFLGLHTVIAALVAVAFRFNKIALFTGVYINNPFLTLVPVALLSYGIGAFALGRPLKPPAEGLHLLTDPHPFTGDYWREVWARSGDVLWPFFIGSSVLSVVCSLAAYPLTLYVLRRRRAVKAN
jgi:uncharacterized protein (DUF2062 family)